MSLSSVTAEQLAAKWGARVGDPEVARCLAEADALLTETLGAEVDPLTGGTVYAYAYRVPPAEVLDQMIRDVAGELFRRGDTASAPAQYADFAGAAPARAPRDPLALVWPILSRYVVRL